MRKAILCLLLFAITGRPFSQQNVPAPIFLPDRYLEKSRAQKVGAFVLLGASAGLFVKGFATEIEEGGGEGFYAASGASLVGSVVLFVASARNKHKGRAISFTPVLKAERAFRSTPAGIKAHPCPSAGLRVQL